jgi:hypothetical protein
MYEIKQWSVLFWINMLFFLHLLLNLVFYHLLDLLHLQVNFRLTLIRLTLNLGECVALVHFFWSQFFSRFVFVWQLTRSRNIEHSLELKLQRHFLRINSFLSTFERVCFVLLWVKHCRCVAICRFSQWCHHYHLLGSFWPSFYLHCVICYWMI